MRKIIVLLLASIAIASPAWAGSGKAIVPTTHYYRASSTFYWFTSVFITNVTNHAVMVTPYFYDQSGNIVSASWLSYIGFSNGNTEIPANSSAMVQLFIPSGAHAWGFGRATIEWINKAGDDDTVALIAHGYMGVINGSMDSRVSVPINNGMPF